MIAKVIILSLYVTYIMADTLRSSPFRSCGKGIPTPYFFSLANCGPTQSICPLYMGTTVETIFTYTSPYKTRLMTAKAAFQFPKGLFTGWIPYMGFLKSGCINDWGGHQCPVRKGQVGSYSTDKNLTVPEIPGVNNIRLNIKFMMKDDEDRDIFCLIVDTMVIKNILDSSATNHVL